MVDFFAVKFNDYQWMLLWECYNTNACHYGA